MSDKRQIHSAPYPSARRARDLETFVVGKNFSMDLIELAGTEWVSPNVFAPKEDGALPFHKDYHNWNAISFSDSNTHLAHQCIDSIDNALILSTMDTNRSY